MTTAAIVVLLGAILLGLISCASPLPARLMPARAKLQGGYWKARDGKVMAYTSWPKEENPLAGPPRSNFDWSHPARALASSASPRAEPSATDLTAEGDAVLPIEKGIIIGVHGLSGAASDFWPLGQRASATGWESLCL